LVCHGGGIPELAEWSQMNAFRAANYAGSPLDLTLPIRANNIVVVSIRTWFATSMIERTAYNSIC